MMSSDHFSMVRAHHPESYEAVVLSDSKSDIIVSDDILFFKRIKILLFVSDAINNFL